MEDVLIFKCPTCAASVTVRNNPLLVVCPKCKSICIGDKGKVLPELWDSTDIKKHLCKIVEATPEECSIEDTLYMVPFLMDELISTFRMVVSDSKTFEDTQKISSQDFFCDPENIPEALREFCKKVEVQYPQVKELQQLPLCDLQDIISAYPNAVFLPAGDSLLDVPEIISDVVTLRERHYDNLNKFGKRELKDSMKFMHYKSEVYKSDVEISGVFYMVPIHMGRIRVKTNGTESVFNYKFHASEYAMCEEVVDESTKEKYAENQPYGFNDFKPVKFDMGGDKALEVLWLWILSVLIATAYVLYKIPFGWYSLLVVVIALLCLFFSYVYVSAHYEKLVEQKAHSFFETVHTPFDAVAVREPITHAVESIRTGRGFLIAGICSIVLLMWCFFMF